VIAISPVRSFFTKIGPSVAAPRVVGRVVVERDARHVGARGRAERFARGCSAARS